MSNLKRQMGFALIVSGPSGTGKSTLCTKLIENNSELFFSVSCTTRLPRNGEKDGVDYHFLKEAEFISKKKADLFIEYAQVHGNYYGTLCSEILDRINQGFDVLLDIDVQGAMQIKKYALHNKLLSKSLEFLFIAPPDMQILEKRLSDRGTDSEEVISVRLENAASELKMWKEYDFLVVNNKLDEALFEMQCIYETMRLKTTRINKVNFI
jgi:guanylate kinase